MALAYPRPLPSGGARVLAVTFRPDAQNAYAPEGGGGGATVSLAQPRWVATFESTTLIEPHLSAWRAWLDAQDRAGASFYGVDPSKRLPRAYPQGVTGLTRAGGGAFDGTSTSWSLDASRTVLTIAALPAGFVVSEQDHLGFAWAGTRRALVEVLEPSAASGAGVWTGEVWPPLPAWLPGDAVLTVAAPACVMKLVPGSVTWPRVTAGARAVAAFSAREHLVP